MYGEPSRSTVLSGGIDEPRQRFQLKFEGIEPIGQPFPDGFQGRFLENLEAMVLFPVAVNATGETDVVFVVTAPSFAEWGRFWDAYPAAEAFGDDDGDMFCPDSVVWEAMKVK